MAIDWIAVELHNLGLRWAVLAQPGIFKVRRTTAQTSRGESADGRRPGGRYSVPVTEVSSILPGVDRREIAVGRADGHDVGPEEILHTARVEVVREWRRLLKRGRAEVRGGADSQEWEDAVFAAYEARMDAYFAREEANAARTRED